MTNRVPEWNPGPSATAEALDGIAAWLEADELWQLAAVFGGERPAVATAGDLLEWLDTFSAEHWDFRAGRERNLAASADLTPSQSAAALECCPALGLAASLPRAARYGAIVMTGGMVRAGVVKPRFVAGLLATGLETSSIVFLGAHRAFVGDEAALAAVLGVRGGDEFDGMVHGAAAAFPAAGERRSAGGGVGNARWSVVSWKTGDGVEVSVVAAPSTRPEDRRADTVDTFRFWGERVRGTVGSALVVTTPVYVPYQAACAVEVLGLEHGLGVQAVGVDAAANDLGEHTQRFLPQHHLQELRSAIRGFRSLESRLSARTAAESAV
jgi:hypothetical protein